MSRKYILRILVVFILMTGSRYISSNNELPQDKDFEINFKLGMEYIEGELYEEAIPVFKELYARDEFNANVNYLLGYCYYKIPAVMSEAIPYFENSLNDIGGDYRPGDYTEVRAPAIAYYYLAEVYFINNDFYEAITNYENLKLLLEYADVNLIEYNKSELVSLIDLKMENCNNGILLSENPVKVEFLDVPGLNQLEYSCYSGRLHHGIWYSKHEIADASELNGDIFRMATKDDKWHKSEKVSGDINSSSDDIFCCLALEDQLLLLSSNRGENSDYDIFYSIKKGKKWSEPKNNLNINSKSNETFASYSPDGNVIYFVSDRAGGQGGKDIYKSEKQSDGSWGEAENLGELINTQFDEESPFLAEDGKTLYFSSRGHNNMGGYDIFYSVFEDDMWLEPQNIGYPINTTLDDLYFSKDTNDICLYSSGRRDAPESFYLFMMKFEEAAVAVAVNSNQSTIDNQEGDTNVVESQFIVTENENENEPIEEIVVVEDIKIITEEEVIGDTEATEEIEATEAIKEEVVVALAVAVDSSQSAVDNQQFVEENNQQRAASNEQPVVVEEVVIVEEEVEMEELVEPEPEKEVKKMPVYSGEDKYYTVQIGAGNMKVQYFDNITEKTVCFSPDGLVRFYVGAFASLAEAVSYRDELIMLGYSDAWTPKIDEMRCKDFDLFFLLNIQNQSSSQNQSTGNYTVQVGAGNMKISYFKKLKNIRVCKGADGMNRFIIGKFQSKQEAVKVRDEVVKLGFPDAWIPEMDGNRCGH